MCDHCNESFPTPAKLARHLATHAGKRRYPCKYCTKSFILSHHLSRHIRSHTTEAFEKKQYCCIECNNIYQSKNNLIDHSIKHARESLICPICQEILPNNEIVDSHIEEHSKIDEHYVCGVCGLIFLKEDHVDQHINVHYVETTSLKDEEIKEETMDFNEEIVEYVYDVEEVDQDYEEISNTSKKEETYKVALQKLPKAVVIKKN